MSVVGPTFFSGAAGGGGGGIASKLLLHFEDGNNSTSFADSSVFGRTLTGNANLKVTTARSKFGTGCLHFTQRDTGGCVIPTTADFAATTATPWCIDFWIYHVATPNATASPQYFIIGGDSSGNINGANYGTSAKAAINYGFGGQATESGAASSNAWHHTCFMFDPSLSAGQTGIIFVDGSIVYQASGTAWSSNAGLQLFGAGGSVGATDGTDFYLDELRFVIGAVPFSPAGFTPPTSPYSS